MRNIKLTLEYDGTGFVGWQAQPNGPSIQSVLEGALRTLLRHDVGVIGAGRTDAGVHALAQVANFRTSSTMEVRALQRGLNALLPPAIAVLEAVEVPNSFHARYSAKGRVYRYNLFLRPTALRRHLGWYVGGYSLAMEKMRACCEVILGEHDFASFCKSDSDAPHTRCTIESAVWHVEDGTMVFRIAANRFLHGMVRALVGTMVEVGRGYRAEGEFERILEARDRTSAGMSAPARGLFLETVIY